MLSSGTIRRFSASPRVQTNAILAALSGLLVFFATTNFTESLWLDELHTAWSVKGGLNEVIPRAAQGNQGPLYFVLMWLWTACVGLNEVTLRLPSLFAGAAIPPVMYWFVRRFARDEEASHLIGLVAAFLAATDMYVVYYAQEARPYAWVILGGILHMGAVLAWLEEPNGRRWWAMVLGAVALFNLHYTAGLLFVAEAAIVLGQKLVTKRGLSMRLSELLLLPVVLAMVLSPSIPQLRLIAERRMNWRHFIDLPHGSDLLLTFPAAVGGVVLAAAWLVRRFAKKPLAVGGGRSRSLIVVGCWLCVPLTTAFFCTRLEIAPFFFPRYLVAALPASWLLSAAIVGLVPSRLIIRAAVIVVLIAAWCVHEGPLRSMWDEGTPLVSRREDWRGAIAWFNERTKDDLVIVDPKLIEQHEAKHWEQDRRLRSYLLFPVQSLYPIAAADERLIPDIESFNGDYAESIKERLKGRRGHWRVSRRPQATDGPFGSVYVQFYSSRD